MFLYKKSDFTWQFYKFEIFYIYIEYKHDKGENKMGEFQIGSTKYNPAEIKGALKKADLDENEKDEIELFTKIAGEDGELSDTEADDFFTKLLSYDDGDKNLTESEMNKYLDAQEMKGKSPNIISSLINKMKSAYEKRVAAEQQAAQEAEDAKIAAECKAKCQNQETITCRDTSGNTSAIAGKLEILDKDFTDFPKALVIVSATSGNRFKYEMFTKQTEEGDQIFYTYR